jgi:hypothetical protein
MLFQTAHILRNPEDMSAKEWRAPSKELS